MKALELFMVVTVGVGVAVSAAIVQAQQRTGRPPEQP